MKHRAINFVLIVDFSWTATTSSKQDTLTLSQGFANVPLRRFPPARLTTWYLSFATGSVSATTEQIVVKFHANKHTVYHAHHFWPTLLQRGKVGILTIDCVGISRVSRAYLYVEGIQPTDTLESFPFSYELSWDAFLTLTLSLSLLAHLAHLIFAFSQTDDTFLQIQFFLQLTALWLIYILKINYQAK